MASRRTARIAVRQASSRKATAKAAWKPRARGRQHRWKRSILPIFR